MLMPVTERVDAFGFFVVANGANCVTAARNGFGGLYVYYPLVKNVRRFVCILVANLTNLPVIVAVLFVYVGIAMLMSQQIATRENKTQHYKRSE